MTPPAPYDAEATGTRAPWWLQPHLSVLCFIVPLYLGLCVSGIQPRHGQAYISFEYALLGGVFLAVLVTTSYLGARPVQAQVRSERRRISGWFMEGLAAITIAAYVLWFWRLIAEPELLRSVLASTALHVRHEISTIPGLTTLTQFGMVYSTLWAMTRWVWERPLSLRFTVYFVIILSLSLLRTLAWGERLATIEVLLPVGVLYALSWRPKSAISRWVVAATPFLIVATAIGFFATTEIFRSWEKQQVGADGLWQYMWDRFVYYYYSSLNNGCGLLTEFRWPEWDMQFTMKWVYTIPGVGGWLVATFQPAHTEALFLQYYADGEFTTYSGVFPVFYDLGITLGLVLAATLGVVMGRAFRGMMAHRPWGMMIYPLFYLHILELLRIYYLGYSRTIPVWLGFALAYWLGGLRSRGTAADP